MGCCCTKPPKVIPTEEPKVVKKERELPRLDVEELENNLSEDALSAKLTPSEYDYALFVGLKNFFERISRNSISEDDISAFINAKKDEIRFDSAEGYKDLFRKGDHCSALYIVLRGEVNLLSDLQFQDECAVLRCFDHMYFGDIEVLYEKPWQTTVHIHKYCVWAAVPSATIVQFLQDTRQSIPEADKWSLLNLYPSPANISDRYLQQQKNPSETYYRRLFYECLRQTQLFGQWTPELIDYLLKYFPYDSLIRFHREGSAILEQNKPSDDIFILVNGRVDIISGQDSSPICTIAGDLLPFVLGEEGVFNSEWSSAFTGRAATPCYTIPIKKKWIIDLSRKNWRFTDVMDPLWFEIRERWEKKLNTPKYVALRKGPFAPYIQLDVIFAWCCRSETFLQRNVPHCYELSKGGEELLFYQGDSLPLKHIENSFFLILKGTFVLVRTTDIDKHKYRLKNNAQEVQEIKAPALIKKQSFKSPVELILYAKTDVLGVSLQEKVPILNNY